MIRITMFKKAILFFVFLAAIPFLVSAQEFDSTYSSGTVIEILETTYPIVFGTEIEFQKLQVQFPDGSIADNIFNDYTPVKAGDKVYVTQGYDPDTETEGYFVREIDRTKSLFILFAIFVIAYLLVAGKRGFRSLIALAISIAAVWFILIPLIVSGYDPIIAGLCISLVILGFAIFITHGVNVVSISSYIGSFIAILITVGFATFAVSLSRISGLVGDESSTISVLYGSAIDLQGLLLAAMIVGILGVLDDVAIMQAAMVREFMYEKKYTLKQIFLKAMRVGQEHAAALVNTLVLAYTAVALPLFLIILAPANQYTGEILPLSLQLSNELFVTEFIRSIVGSLGLVITIPIVTTIAIVLFNKYPPQEPGHVHHHH